MPPRNNPARRTQFNRDLATKLRNSPTEAERKFWTILRSKQLGGLRFRRQQPVGPYIADFFCPAAKLIIELDGDQHGADTNAAYDAIRTKWLEDRGYKVLRFANKDALKSHTAEAVFRAAEERLPLPERPLAVRPSLKGRVE